jgi:hypothetical protein
MSIRRRRRLDPVPHEPSHRRLWQSWWRRCSCGLRAPCVDRLVPAPRLPFPPARNARSAPVTDPQPGGDTGDISTPNVASARHQASRPAGTPTGRDVARKFIRRALAHQDARHEIARAAQDARHEIAEAARKTKVNAPAPGSYAALTRVSGDSRPEAIRDVAASLGVTKPLFPDPAAQIGGLFDGLVLVDPGLVSPTWWRPEPDLDPGEDTRRMCAGVAR